jgi:hypothetical protein
MISQAWLALLQSSVSAVHVAVNVGGPDMQFKLLQGGYITNAMLFAGEQHSNSAAPEHELVAASGR